MDIGKTGFATTAVLVLSLAATLALSACSEREDTQVTSRVAATASQMAINVETIADKLRAPWSVTVLPDGSYLVTEQLGVLQHIRLDGTRTEISGLPDDIYAQGQGGLLDIVLAPDFADTQTVFLSYAKGSKKANRTAIIRARLVDGALIDRAEIFQASPTKDTSSHFGARMVFLPDGTLVMTIGEGFAYREAAQDKGSHLGKTVRLNPDGSAPTDNPFVSVDGVRPEIYSLGHRNAQGLNFDTVGGKLWSHEHGAKGGDELNIIAPGKNYGWPITTTGIDYNGAKISPFQSYAGMEGFVTDWVPSIAPSGLTIYRGDLFADWNGDALVGGLKSRDLRRVDLEDGKAVGEEILLQDLNARIRDVRTAPDGSILILTDDKTNGKLLRITPK
ncbi:MAG: PQQ-dependent sugar dehydrogenase [Robiginitomaculum sp.]|nr:PQQ-dependent sugar dehydrogenase [Robiginitomaculum sp.]